MSYYYVSYKMKVVVEILIGAGVAREHTATKEPNDRGLYSFELRERNWSWTEYSREPELVTLGHSSYEKVKPVITAALDGMSPEEIVEFVEDHARNRGGLEELPIHSCVVEVALACALERKIDDGIVVNGNFNLIGRLPHGRLTVNGNVETIEGSTGQLLTVNGNVRRLGCGPFWSPNPVLGEVGKIVINGNLDGYKTGIENPDLNIEVIGDVTTLGAFLYRSCVFKSLVIRGNLLTENSICPGFFAGEMTVLGNAPHLEKYIRGDFRKSSGYRSGRGNIRVGDRWLLRNGHIISAAA